MVLPPHTFPGSRSPIASRRHPLVARFRDVARGANRNAMLLEGEHLVEVALELGYPIEVLAAAWPGPCSEATVTLARRAEAAGAAMHAVSRSVLEALSPVRTPGGVVALAPRPAATSERVVAGPAPLVVVACDVQDPGNVGAIVRAADACGATGVICAGDCADPFGWKALRGSMGSALRVPVAAPRQLAEALDIVRAHGLATVAAVGGAGLGPDDVDWTRPTALLVGNEGAGLPGAVVAAAAARVSVPMRAGVESLNVAVATGILLYEASRQRGGR